MLGVERAFFPGSDSMQVQVDEQAGRTSVAPAFGLRAA